MWGTIGSRAETSRPRPSAGFRTPFALAAVVSLVGATLVSQALAIGQIGGVTAAGAATNTIVSIEFDDGLARQYQTRSLLSARGMHATYYDNSSARPPEFNTMSESQLRDLADDGNEIGGHTLDHADLTTVGTAEATRQICTDRTELRAEGFNALSFAYPYGHFNATIENVAKNCGYTSARGVDGIVTPEGCGGNCPFAESIPPKDAFATRTPENADEDTPLSELEGFVTQAEQHGGGWVQLVFHDICSPGPTCDFYSIPPAQFATLLDWIAARASNGTIVRTVGEVMAMGIDSTPPSTVIVCNGEPCAAGFYAGPAQVALAATDSAGGSGVSIIRYTTDGSAPTRSGAGGTTYNGPFTVSSTQTVNYRAYDRANNAEGTTSRFLQIDTTAPGSSILCDGGACPVRWTHAPVRVELAATDNAGGSGVAAIRVTGDASEPTPSSTPYTGPFVVSSALTLEYRAFDNVENAGPTGKAVLTVDTIAPVPLIACDESPCSKESVRGPVRVSLSATDAGGSGVAGIRYTTDGSVPTAASPLYSAPFTVVASANVRFRAIDRGGMSSRLRSALIRIDARSAGHPVRRNGR